MLHQDFIDGEDHHADHESTKARKIESQHIIQPVSTIHPIANQSPEQKKGITFSRIPLLFIALSEFAVADHVESEHGFQHCEAFANFAVASVADHVESEHGFQPVFEGVKNRHIENQAITSDFPTADFSCNAC